MSRYQPSEDVPLDDREAEREAFILKAASVTAGVPIEELLGATVIVVRAEPGGHRPYEHRFGNAMLTNAALLQSFMENTRHYGIRQDLRDTMQMILDGLIAVATNPSRYKRGDTHADQD